MLSQMKNQLNKVKDGKLKNFGFGSILTAFALEKIPLMQPQYIDLGVPSPTEPRMQRWVDHMSRHAGQSQISFNVAFFRWFDRQEMAFSEYHMLVWISGTIRIWYCQTVLSGMLLVRTSTILPFVVFIHNVLVLYSFKTLIELMCACRRRSCSSGISSEATCYCSGRGTCSESYYP